MQESTAREWIYRIEQETKEMESEDKPAGGGDVRKALTLTEERTIEWREDARFEEVMRLRRGLPGEDV